MLGRHQRLLLAVFGGLLLAFMWFWGIHPARGLDRGEAEQVVIATNRVHQPLPGLGYRQADCTVREGMDPVYTCYLSEEAVGRMREAVHRPSRSYYVLGTRNWLEDPVHVISFGLPGGRVYLLAVTSLEEADRGYFYGYASEGPSIMEQEIRWFRYINPELGEALKALRSAGS